MNEELLKMQPFRSDHAKKLLIAHHPGQRVYVISEIGLDPCKESVRIVDEAYEELMSHGLVEQMTTNKIMPYNNGPPKCPFRITSAGEEARERLNNPRPLTN